MTKRIFIWVAHPKTGSLCEAIADAYQAGVEASGATVRRINLADMNFDLDVSGAIGATPPLEPDLVAWQDALSWADHVLIVHPYWWGAMPTKAKAVLDRALTSGFAFKYHGRGMGWDKLLEGKTADAIITSDTPPLIDTLIYRKPARRVIKNQVLKFCGIEPKKIVQLGSVKLASAKKIQSWLSRAEHMGAAAAAHS